MAFNKKKKRTITVSNQKYFWCASGNDGFINLFIMIDSQGSQKLNCKFEYHQDRIYGIDGSCQLTNQFIITPFIVRQVILYAIKEEKWEPCENTGMLDLGYLDEKIDLRLCENKIDKLKKKTQP